MAHNHKVAFVYWGWRTHPRREMCAKYINADFYQIKNSKLHPFGEMAHATLLARKLAQKNYDAILFDSIIGMECAYAYKKLFKGSAKIIMYVVDPTFHKPLMGEGVRKKFYLTLASAADGFLVPSKKNHDAVRAFFTEPPIGFAGAFLYRGTKKFSDIKPDLKSRSLVFIGAVRQEKNIEGMVGGYRSAAEDEKMPHLYLLGYGTDTYLQDKEINATGITGVGHSAIEKYLAKSTFLIHPARFDSAPCVIIEAMAAGVIPVLSTNCGNYDIVEAIDKRLIIHDISPEGVAQKLKELNTFTDKEIASLSKKMRAHSKNYSKEKGLAAFKKAFNEVVKKIQ